MNHRKPFALFPILFSMFAMVASTWAAGLQVQGNVGKLIPVALTGYQGEVAKVLAFDLEVMGCKIVPKGDASFVLNGKNGPNNLTGVLSDNAGNFGFNLNINGAAPRVLAHALSNATIKAITGQNGIAHTRILFTMKTAAREWEVFQSDFDGHNPVALTNDKSIVESPMWMPNHSGLFYTSWMTIGGLQNTTVVKHNLKTGKREVFSRYKGLNTGGAMAPNGSVALILSKNRSTDVYFAPPKWEFLKDIKGEKLLRLTRSREEKSSPTWSPDGQWLCFHTLIDGKHTLVKVPAGGGQMVSIPTRGAFRPTQPSWSPDGKWIAFTQQRGGFQIGVVPAAGGNVKIYCEGEDPAWAANSRNIIFTRRAGGVNKKRMAILDVPTEQVKILPAFRGGVGQPAWQ